MKQLLFILFYVILIVSCSRTINTPHYFYDTNNNRVSKSEFLAKRDFAFNIDVYYQTDTSKVGVLVNRLKYGKFTEHQFEMFKEQLFKSIDTIVEVDRPIIINYFFDIGDGEDCANSIFPLPYTKKMEEQFSNVHSLYVTNSDYSFDLLYQDILTDKIDLIRRIFMKYKVRCLNYIAIKVDGSYSYCYGDGCEMYYILEREWPKI